MVLQVDVKCCSPQKAQTWDAELLDCELVGVTTATLAVWLLLDDMNPYLSWFSRAFWNCCITGMSSCKTLIL